MKNHHYEQIAEPHSPLLAAMPNQGSEALATRLEKEQAALAAFAATLSDAEWQTHLPKDGPENRRGRAPRRRYVPN